MYVCIGVYFLTMLMLGIEPVTPMWRQCLFAHPVLVYNLFFFAPLPCSEAAAHAVATLAEATLQGGGQIVLSGETAAAVGALTGVQDANGKQDASIQQPFCPIPRLNSHAAASEVCVFVGFPPHQLICKRNIFSVPF